MPDFLTGASGRLYIGANLLDAGTVEFWDPGQWPLANELAYVGDVTVGGSPVEVDTSTRQTVRTGFTSSTEIAQAGEITFAIQSRLITDDLMRKLAYARKERTQLALLALTGLATVEGNWGNCGNFTINFSNGQPVQGIQTLDLTAKLANESYVVEVDNLGALIEMAAPA